MFVDDDKCNEFALDPKTIASIARRISKAAVEANALGLKVFGGSGSGTLRIFGKGTSGNVAMLDGTFDGGDGGDDY
jgi:hypothetical protein